MGQLGPFQAQMQPQMQHQFHQMQQHHFQLQQAAGSNLRLPQHLTGPSVQQQTIPGSGMQHIQGVPGQLPMSRYVV